MIGSHFSFHLVFYHFFLYCFFSIAKSIEGMQEHIPSREKEFLKSCLLVTAGLASLSLGGKRIVDGAAHMALKLGMSESLMGLTIAWMITKAGV
jgi:cation:H+ antiporter